MFDEQFLRMAILAAPAILFSLTVHEFFHAYTAHKFGDDTAKNLGRMSLNPLVHLDLFGTIMMFLSSFRFGWAKPVPVNLMNLRNPRVADFWISAAGPLSNIGLGIIFGLLFRIMHGSGMGMPESVQVFLLIAVRINVGLAFFNLIPLFPLDGSHILRNVLPESMGASLAKLDAIAPMLLMGLIIVGGFWIILGPFIQATTYLFTGVHY